MALERGLYEFRDFVDLLGVVTALQLARIEDEERVRLLREWVGRMGESYEEWMTTVVTGPPVSGDVGAEVEVTVG